MIKILLALPGVPIKAEFITRYNIACSVYKDYSSRSLRNSNEIRCIKFLSSMEKNDVLALGTIVSYLF